MAFPLTRKTVLFALLAAALLAGLAALWLYLDIDRAMLTDMVRAWLEQVRGTPLALPAVCGLYLLAGITFFPVMALNLAMAMVFGPVRGVLYGLTGAMLSATVFFYVGRFARKRHFDRLLQHPKIKRLDEALQRGGVIGVALVRLVPVAPYTAFNLAGGISSLRFADFMAGTFLSALPGAIARGIVGGSLMNLFLDPTRKDMLWLGGGLALWLLVIAGSHVLLKKTRTAV